MRVAFIGPDNYIDWIPNTFYHLSLPWNIRRYREHNVQGYMILDNGACEGKLADDLKLVNLIELYDPDEVVVPDVLRDYHDTMVRLDRFRPVGKAHADRVNWMGVAQGTSWEEVEDCIQRMADEEWITALGIPKHMNDTLETMYARASLGEWIFQMDLHGGFPAGIHYLGATSWLREVQALAQLPQEVARGIDTSMPITLGIKGVDISRINTYKYEVKRPEAFFEQPVDLKNVANVLANMETYLSWSSPLQ